MDYRQMVLKAMDSPDEKTMKVLDMTDEMLCRLSKDRQEEMDDFLVRLSGVLEGGHFSLATAEWAMERMQPTLLIHNGERYRGTLLGFMADKGLNAAMCRRMVDEAYRKAYDEGLKYGYSAPPIRDCINEYDAYAAFAMVLADYWMDVCGDMDEAAMLTYQWLSDPDADGTKTWDYLMGR